MSEGVRTAFQFGQKKFRFDSILATESIFSIRFGNLINLPLVHWYSNSKLFQRRFPISTKIRLMKALVWPVATYGCESWTLRKNEETRLDAFEMKELRRMLRVSWTAKKTNEWVLNKAGVKRELLDTVKARKLAYYCKGPGVQLPLSPKFAFKKSHTRFLRESPICLC